ncbi:enoyl-CoA hydratase/isomerase family protein [Geodermatophilus sabuli]|uniref:Enoyl-CoA hydratase/carnithine racemase n=1 Tax=Geodermatophilus sabuli TaxID=1564158 RepID=A0A285EB03_9ACTN|nr:enoyl-CoA hydratase-related protein [Geodermatophilus sabuli]MBB3085545.1 enoyl-CoA hydratase/carnithine racemase [Geodermatophilus sabuli]SNX96033.1 Enoyl-CoA hydratase/carnithine racemase [Geodermatophilus sabuli]
MPDLEYTVDGGVGTILLNRPHAKNAFTLEMVEAWAAALRSARTDPDVRVVVVTGAGDAFCAGIDLSVLEAVGDEPLALKSMLTGGVHEVARAVDELSKPVIAAVNGAAVGAGMDMALMCDIRVLSQSARLSEGYIRVGLVPGDGGCYYLPRLVGMSKALELLWTGDFVDAEEALRIGLATKVYADADFTDAYRTFATRLAEQPPINVAMIKRAAQQSVHSDLRTALDLISSHLAVVHGTRDSREARSALRERRRPSFEGR